MDSIQLEQDMVEYLTARCNNCLRQRDAIDSGVPDIDKPSTLPIHVIQELDWAALILDEASASPLKLDWDMPRYASAGQKPDSTRPFSKYPKVYGSGVIDTPHKLVDVYGHCFGWYLPGILSRQREAKMIEATKNLNNIFRSSLVTTSGNWRVDSKFYMQDSAMEFEPGVATMSPGWFEQAHDTHEFEVKSSASLRDPEVQKWLEGIKESAALFSAMLAVMHPALYQAGKTVMEYLRRQERLYPYIEDWPTVFNGVSVIANRLTPPHLDTGGLVAGLDVLCSIGEYEDGGFQLPDVGWTFDYKPRTVMAIAGKALRHEATHSRGGRVCYAWFMRDNVHHRAGVKPVVWSE